MSDPQLRVNPNDDGTIDEFVASDERLTAHLEQLDDGLVRLWARRFDRHITVGVSVGPWEIEISGPRYHGERDRRAIAQSNRRYMEAGAADRG